MRLTYSAILAAHLRNIGKTGTTSSPLITDFQYSLGNRYQMIMGTLSQYINQDTKTASTVASQQYYYYPVGTVGVDSAMITIGSMNYTLTPIYAQYTWNQLNALAIQPTAIPQFIFPRKDDFGIWPIPQAAYTITFQRFFRDRNLLVDDVTASAGVVTAGDQTVTDAGALFTAAMVGRWFSVTSTSTVGQGYWYRIASVTSSTELELETYWAGATTSGVSWVIGETPEIPEEAHVLLPAGTAADYYAGLRDAQPSAAYWDNVFWTGSGVITSRNLDDKNIISGLIGLYRKYKDRERDVIVERRPGIIPAQFKIWATTLT